MRSAKNTNPAASNPTAAANGTSLEVGGTSNVVVNFGISIKTQLSIIPSHVHPINDSFTVRKYISSRKA
ncbi:hypothetical protein HanXRQr2_Chr17g0802461 [Helianthus annuus]|uniref:Uncharacterized protein n=1 Tax=Helianthus annuus TaxID=4232 RepID=A0A251RU82_HELAN|nr:hypothetical protein HanXRQr2_Chr17g0802461 [Helianthus annuus]KAJ0813135.1 hypothetical protein HanPSC8_Chr17g0770011 [Helianthus annuus]